MPAMGVAALLAITLKPGGNSRHFVAVAHPHIEQAVAYFIGAILNIAQQFGMAARANFRVAKFRTNPFSTLPPSCAAMVCMP